MEFSKLMKKITIPLKNLNEYIGYFYYSDLKHIRVGRYVLAPGFRDLSQPWEGREGRTITS